MTGRQPDEWLLRADVQRHVFLSAHFDDVAFSCGGTVARLAAADHRPVVVVVFAAAPDDAVGLSAFARAHDAIWGLGGDPASSNRGRQAEELAAAKILGAELRTLPFRDAIYRSDRYEGNERLFGQVHPDERELPAVIAAKVIDLVGPLEGTRCYVPLAVGRHVDHQLTFSAGQVLAQQGGDVWCYEDLPYSLRSDELRSRLAQAASEIGETATATVEPVWQARMDAVLAHQSQLASAFGYVDVAPTATAITSALARVAARDRRDGVRTERFWQVRPR